MKTQKLLLAAAMIALAGPAMASTMVLGETKGAACYQEAKGGHTDRDALNTCTSALDDGFMTRGDIAATYVNRGIVRSNRGDFQGAISDYQHALKMDPDLGEAFANRGTAYIRMSRYSEALNELNTALSLELEEPANVYYNRAIVHEHFGDNSKALRDYRKATELRPNWKVAQAQLTRFVVKSD